MFFHAWFKVDICRSNIKRDIHDKKIKVERLLINSMLLMYKHFCHVPYTIRYKIRLSFDALFAIVAFIDPEISPFF